MAEEKEVKETGLSAERLAINQAYIEQEGRADAPKPAEVQPEPEQPPVEAEKPTEEQPKEEPVAEKPQEKLVPKQALDEERTKRKKERELREALEAKVRDYEKKLAPPEEEQPIEDYDAKLRELDRKVKTFEQLEARREELAREEVFRQERERLNNMISRADIDLAGEGYPGFKFMVNAVTEELQGMKLEDPELAASFDNPDGWKKIFKEKVYPAFKKHQDETHKKLTLENKKALKQEANLVTTAGKTQAKPEEDDPNKWDEKRLMQEHLKIRSQGVSQAKSLL